MKKLFQNLIWPAVAGNVTWAFFTVAVSEQWNDTGVIPRLLSLILIAVYLCYDWITTEEAGEKKKLKENYWVGDIAHAAAIIVFAISAQSELLWSGAAFQWVNWTLTAVFLAGGLGHLFGAWEPNDIAKNIWPKRLSLMSINFFGIIVYWSLASFIKQESLWQLPASILGVLLLWRPLRGKIYSY